MKLEEVYWAGIKQFRELTDEFCSMDGELEQDGLPRYRIQIVEKHPDGQLCARTTFSIKFDQTIATYLRDHPVFRKDCRPFVLWSVMEVIWNVKILETEFGKPKVIQMVLQPIQGGQIEVTIGVEVLIDTGGVTIVQLVNYANTHLFDQLGEIFKQNPGSKPPVEYLKQKKAEFYEKLRTEKAEHHRQQLQNLNSRRTLGGEYVVFIDESGDLGFKSTPTEYVVKKIAAHFVDQKKQSLHPRFLIGGFHLSQQCVIPSIVWLELVANQNKMVSVLPDKIS
jgi:hypothetical protein